MSEVIDHVNNEFTARKMWSLLAPLVMVFLTTADGRGQSALDGFDPNVAELSVRAVLVQPDGKILIGGPFHSLSPNGGPPVTRNCIARLNPDGTLDAAFDPNAGEDGGLSVDSIALQADGKILVVGNFSNIGGQSRRSIARLDPMTGAADSFDPNPNDLPDCVTVQADGKILVGGQFSSIGGAQRGWIARLDPTTGLADSFDPQVTEGAVSSIIVQANGKILIAGGFTGVGGQTRNRIARVNSDGTLDAAFNSGTNGVVYAVGVQADGKVLVGGTFTGVRDETGTYVTRHYIARLEATTGSVDSFDPNADDWVRSIAVQGDGKILVGGDFVAIGGAPRHHIARLDVTTALADPFDPNPNTSSIYAITVQADRKIIVGGYILKSIGGQIRNGIARLETDGRLDQTLNTIDGLGGVYTIAFQPDGKILVGGTFTTILGSPRNNIARLNTDASLDTTFDPNAGDYVSAIAVQPDGKILVGGAFASIGGNLRLHIARLDGETGIADSFAPNADGEVSSITTQSDGKIVVGGDFTSIGGQPRNRIARLDPISGLADSFDPNPNDLVYTLAVQMDGKVVAGGFFTSIGGQNRRRIAQLDGVTGFADSWNPDPNGVDVWCIALQSDGKIVAGGDFTLVGGHARNNIVRLDPISGLADSFDPHAGNSVITIAVQSDGKIVASGYFGGSIGGQMRRGIARLEGTNGLADSFDPNPDGNVYSIAMQSDGKIFATGPFSSIGGQTRNWCARLSNDTAALQDLAVMPTAVTWTRGGSSPNLIRATFEYSSDNVTYTSLGNATAVGNTWTLTGLSLPIGQNFYVRARGYYRSGIQNSSESITESLRYGPAAIATPIPTPTSTPTSTPTPTPTLTPRPATLANISTRLQVGTGGNVMIAGFIVTGTAPKHVIIRAIGPSLLGVPNVLVNPRLELHDGSGANIGMNDNWQTTQPGGIITADQVQEIQDSGLAPTDPAESAIIGNLTPGVYTAIVEGVDAGTGVGLIEVYDLDTASNNSRLANISTRGFVQTGNDVMIGGIILVTQSTQVIVRAIGLSLGQAGVPDPLANPQLELHDVNGTLIAQNDDWQTTQIGGIITQDQVSEIQDSGLAPTDPAESAIIGTLQPGAFTAIVRGVNQTTGNALVEVYELP